MSEKSYRVNQLSVKRVLESAYEDQIKHLKIVYDLRQNEEWFARAGRWAIITLNFASDWLTVAETLEFAHEWGHLAASHLPELPDALEEIPSTLMEYWYAANLPEGDIKRQTYVVLQENHDRFLGQWLDDIQVNGGADGYSGVVNKYAVGHIVSRSIPIRQAF